MDDFLDIDFRWGADSRSGTGPHRVISVGRSRQHLLHRPIQRFSPRIRDKVNVIIAIQRGQVARQRIVRATSTDAATIISARRCGPAVGNEGNDVELEIIFPIRRLAAKLFNVATQDGVDITVGTHEHYFDGWRGFGAAIATKETKPPKSLLENKKS